MRLLKLICLSVLTTALACAATITIDDAYVPNPPFSASTNGDVFGKLAYFDIKSVQFSLLPSNNVEVVIQTNYNNGDTTLAPFAFYGQPVPPLIPGDILFLARNGDYLYGVPVIEHDNLTPGALYEIDDALTAWEVLHVGTPTSTFYRPNAPVLMNPAGAQWIADPVSGPLTSSLGGPLVQIVMEFPTNAAFRADLESGMLLAFANMTCGNDLLQGAVQGSNVPEPASLGLIGAGLVALGLYRRRSPK